MRRITTTEESEKRARYREKLSHYKDKFRDKFPKNALDADPLIQVQFMLWCNLETIAKYSIAGYSMSFSTLWDKFIESDEGVSIVINASRVRGERSMSINNYEFYHNTVDAYLIHTLWAIHEKLIVDYDFDIYMFNNKIKHADRNAVHVELFKQSNCAFKRNPVPPSNDFTDCLGDQYYKDLGKFEYTVEEFNNFFKSKECLELYNKPMITLGQGEVFNQIVTTQKQVRRWISENAGTFHYSYRSPKPLRNNSRWGSMIHVQVTPIDYERYYPWILE